MPKLKVFLKAWIQLKFYYVSITITTKYPEQPFVWLSQTKAIHGREFCTVKRRNVVFQVRKWPKTKNGLLSFPDLVFLIAGSLTFASLVSSFLYYPIFLIVIIIACGFPTTFWIQSLQSSLLFIQNLSVSKSLYITYQFFQSLHPFSIYPI